MHVNKNRCIYIYHIHVCVCVCGQDAWFTLATIKSDTAKALAGGISRIALHILRAAFFDTTSHDLHNAGFHVDIDGVSRNIFMNVSMVLADAEALHYLFLHKGAGGLKICPLCTNVFNSNEVREIVLRNPRAVHHHCHTLSKMELCSPELLDMIFARLMTASGAMGKGAFKELERSLGWSFAHDTMVSDVFKRNCSIAEHVLR